MEITPLPLKGVFAIIDLFQAVLEPSELFLQEEREMFQCAHGLRLEIPLQAPTTAPTTKHNVPTMLRGTLPNVHHSYTESNTFINIPST